MRLRKAGGIGQKGNWDSITKIVIDTNIEFGAL